MNKTALLISGLGLGAGLIFMLDPERGERRRAMARAQLERYRRQTDDLWDHTSRSLGRQARELFASAPLARRYRRPGPGELLRAQIGHVVSQAGTVDVTAQQGRVTLSGAIAAHEVEKLLSAVASVAGVTAVVNRLEVNHAPASVAGGQHNHATHAGDGWNERL